MTKYFMVFALLMSTQVFAEEVVRINIGKTGKTISQRDLERRVILLERAVWQLQKRVFDLESAGSQPKPPTTDTWLCSTKAFGNEYTATGGSKAVAKHRAIEACKRGNDGNSFHCRSVTCEN